MSSEIVLPIFLSVCLFIVLCIALKNRYMIPIKNTGFILTNISVFFIVLAHSGRYIAKTYNLLWVSAVSNTIIYTLGPMNSFFLYISTIKRFDRREFLIGLPLLIPVILNSTSAYTGLVFTINVPGYYARGPLYPVHMFFCGAYMIIWLISSGRSFGQYKTKYKLQIIALGLFLASGMIIQTVNSSVRITWSVISLSLIIYYGIMMEIDSEEDEAEIIKNRRSFFTDGEELTYRNSYAVVLLNLKNTKYINNNFGYKAGDELIDRLSKSALKHFGFIGRVYKTNGDDFSIITTTDDEERICETLSLVIDDMDKIGEEKAIPSEITAGIAYHPYGSELSFENVYKLASGIIKNI